MTLELGARAFVWLQHVLPQHALSRLVLAATRVRTPWFKNLLTRGFLGLYAVDLAEAVQPDPYAYPSFNDFFTRALRAASRPVCTGPGDIASPVDGRVSECGRIDGASILQAKGRRYSLADLLAGEPAAQKASPSASARAGIGDMLTMLPRGMSGSYRASAHWEVGRPSTARCSPSESKRMARDSCIT